MKTPSPALRTLRDELAATASPRLKLKLLAHAWRTVREMSPEDRRALAAEIGLKEAQGILDNLAHRRGSRAAGRILQRLGLSADDEPLDLPGLVKDLTSGSGRPAATTPSDDPPVDPILREPTAQPTAPGPRRDPVPPAPPLVAGPHRTSPAPVAAPAKPETSPEEREPVPTTPMPETVSPIPAPSRLSERLRSAVPLILRFRILRTCLDGGIPLEDAEIEEVLASFPTGWARRRALSGLFRSGHPASLAQALSLIEGLELPWHRRWCASDLLRTRPLSSEEEDLVKRWIPDRTGRKGPAEPEGS